MLPFDSGTRLLEVSIFCSGLIVHAALSLIGKKRCSKHSKLVLIGLVKVTLLRLRRGDFDEMAALAAYQVKYVGWQRINERRLLRCYLILRDDQ